MEGDETYDRALGALYGIALGDATGMPSELWPRERIRSHFGWIEDLLPAPDGHFIVDGWAAGQVTDDTQQSLMLADAIIEDGGRLQAATVARHLVAWADRVGATEGHFLGPSSSRAITALRDGAAPEEAGFWGETNGAAMRIAPVGIATPSNDLETLTDRVEAASLPSHGTNVAIAGAAMIAAAVSAAVDGSALPDVVERAIEASEIGMRRGRAVPAASLAHRTRWALARVRAGGTRDEVLQELYDMLGAGVATTESVPAAMALVVMGDGDPVTATRLAANLGGDCDTVGAMVGAICGALAGWQAIPERYRRILTEVNDLDLERTARALVQIRLASAVHGRVVEDT